MQINIPIADALARYLDLSSKQMQVTAGNMANVDTPDFKTQGFDFENAFHDAMHTGKEVPDVDDVSGLIARPDGNNVSLERESMMMAKAQLQFRTGVELLKHQMSMLSEAIRSEGK